MAEIKKKTTAKPTKKTSAAKKVAPKKTVAKKVSPTKATPKKAAPKKPAAKKTPSKSIVSTPKPSENVAIFKIMRTDVKGNIKWDKFKVPYDPSTTVLGALEDIKGAQDGSLTFRRSCRASICGSCGMFIANRSRLACKTKVQDLIQGNATKNIAPVEKSTIVIQPQKNQKVIRDLVVDIQPFFGKVRDITPYVQSGTETEKNVDKTSFEQVNMVSNCIMCGACYSDCTAMVENPNFIGPAALAKAFRFVADPREGRKTDRLEELSKKNGIWDCVRCNMCIDACPKDVAPMEAIVKLRGLAIESGIHNNPGARHAMSFKKDISTWGVLNEPFMLLKTKGFFGALKVLGDALNLAKKGKIPNPLPFDHKVQGLDEIKAIYKELAENPIDVQTKALDEGPGAG